MNISGTTKAFNLIRGVLDTTKSMVSPIEFSEHKPVFEPKCEMYFEGASPEECGIESCHVVSFIDELTKNKKVGLQSIMLMRNNKVFFEGDIGNQDSRYPKATFSECKSIVSLAIGVLVSKGKLRLNDKVLDIIGKKAQPMAKIRLNNLTVKHLLNMTASVTFNESEAMVTKDWIKGFLNSDTDGENGKKFRYNSLNTYMLSAIIKEKTQMSLSEFLDSTLFKELEIEDYYWEKCPLGIEKGGWGLYIRREDIAKLGLLVMNRGVWNQKRLISPKYIDLATKKQISVPEECGDFDYGFQIWCGKDTNSFLFNGMLGQNLLGYKDSGIMIIANCSNYDMFQQNDFFGICNKYFAREFPEGLPESQKDYERLNSLKEALKAKKEPRSFLEATRESRNIQKDIEGIDGKVFYTDCPNSQSTGFAPLFLQLIQGNYTKGLESVAFQKSGDGLTAIFREADEEHHIEIGFDKRKRNTVTIHGEPFAVTAKGRFSQNEDGIPVLIIDCDFLETPYTRSYKFFFEEGNYYGIFRESPGTELALNYKTLVGLLGDNGKKLESFFSKVDGDYLGVKFEKAFCPRLVFATDKVIKEQEADDK